MEATGSLLDRRLVVVSGKGGVGRTTFAAALARAAARSGRNVLLAQMDSPPRLARLLGARAPIGSEVAAVGDGLWAVNMTPRSALHEYALMVLRYETLYRALFENKAVRGFLAAVPGLDAYAMLGKAWWHTGETHEGRRRYDLVVLDAPASGHAARMLTIPEAILSAMPKGPLARDAAAMRELLADPTRAAFVIVTLPEDLPARETAQLARELRTSAVMPLGPLVVNGMPAATFAAPALGRLLQALPGETDGALGTTLAGARLLGERRRDAERVLAGLRADPGLPIIELPRLPATDLGPAEIEEVASILLAALQAPAGQSMTASS
jgi:anion-transporting  ArsA/GET3 family ATPase